MAKTATVGARIDEKLKKDAQNVFDKLGVPMSMAIEIFLHNVVETGKLPFTIGEPESNRAESRQRQRSFWKAFTLWIFRARIPRFHSGEIERQAIEELGFDGHRTGDIAIAYINADSGGYPDRMSEEQRAASRDFDELDTLIDEAKELIYWALGMDKVFVPGLASEYADETDIWKYHYLKREAKVICPGNGPEDSL